MDIDRRLPRERRPRASLTPRQHEVLAAIASGKTNGQIAERLGISLDGVKYHVREILGLLGVDTREEAAEWWRQNQGFPARMAVVTNFGRTLMRAKLALVGSGAAAAAALGVVAVLMLTRGDGAEEGALGPGVWTALADPAGEVVVHRRTRPFARALHSGWSCWTSMASRCARWVTSAGGTSSAGRPTGRRWRLWKKSRLMG